MLKILCPRCGNPHYSDQKHVGKMLRCAKCGDAVQIGSSSSACLTNQFDRSFPSTQKTKSAVNSFRSLRDLLQSHKTKLWIASIGLFSILGAWSIHAFIMSGEASEDIFARVSRENEEERQNLRKISKANELVDDLHPARIEGPPEMHRTLPSGTRVRSDVGTDGKGILTIDNYTNSDSVVKVISLNRTRTIRYVFVEHDSKVNLPEIPQGTFKVRFCFGDDWDSQRKFFTRPYSFFEFGQQLRFNETREDDGIEYVHQEITLHTTPQGNAPKVVIDKNLFDSD